MSAAKRMSKGTLRHCAISAAAIGLAALSLALVGCGEGTIEGPEATGTIGSGAATIGVVQAGEVIDDVNDYMIDPAADNGTVQASVPGGNVLFINFDGRTVSASESFIVSS